MTDDDTRAFGALMMGLSEVFDTTNDPSPARVEIYFRALSGFSIEQVSTGVSELIRTRTYNNFPKPAEIIECIEGDGVGQAIDAWADLRKKIRHVGPYKTVVFSDPVTHSIVEFWGGWENVCMFPEAEMKWKLKEFERLYPVFKKRGGHPERAVGIIDSRGGLRESGGILDNSRPVAGLLEEG